MTLLAGDLTTPARLSAWLPSPAASPPPLYSQLISSMTALLYNKLNRSRLFSQNFTRIIDGVGNYQIVLPDWPVTAISLVQIGGVSVPASPLPLINPVNNQVTVQGQGWGYRYVPWLGNLPGDPVILEFLNGAFWSGVQNIKVQYTAGYLVQNEPWTVPASPGPYTVTVLQQEGIWCRDNGVTYAATGVALTPVKVLTAAGQYIPPVDTAPGAYTLDSADANAALLFNYSFIPADLEEACIQMVAERLAYRQRVGVLSQSLGGQETMSYLRGGGKYSTMELPPEVEALIQPYVSVIPPSIGAPLYCPTRSSISTSRLNFRTSNAWTKRLSFH